MSKAAAPYPDIQTLILEYKKSRKVPPPSDIAPYLYPIDRYTVAAINSRPTVRFYQWLPASRRTRYLYKFNGGPMPTTLPSISGTPVVGQPLTCSPGNWYGTPVVTFRYAWLRDGAPFGPTGDEYVTVEQDRLHDISCRVSASDITGTTEVDSNSVIVSLLDPINNDPPVVTGVNYVDQRYDTTDGTWTWRDPTQPYTYQWKRRLPAEPVAVDIPGATENFYILKSSEIGYYVTVEVTAYNDEGFTPAESIDGSIVTNGPPVNTKKPILTDSVGDRGVIYSGEFTKCTPGIWSYKDSDIIYDYDWQLNDISMSPPAPNQGTYLVKSEDRNHKLSCVVTATNPTAPARVGVPAKSNSGSVKWPQAEVVTDPIISGSPYITTDLTITTEAEILYADDIELTWRRAQSGQVTFLQTGGLTYTIKPEDIGGNIFVRYLASNSDTTTTTRVVSDRIGPIIEGVPVNTTPPAIFGDPNSYFEVDSNAFSDNGVWLPSFNNYDKQWLTDGAPVDPPVTSDLYTIKFEDVGKALGVSVVCINDEGIRSLPAYSTTQVIQYPKVIPGTIRIDGIFEVTEEIEAVPLLWGYTDSYTYQWYRDSELSPIPGATGNTYILEEEDRTFYVFCIVTGINSGRPSSVPLASSRHLITYPSVGIPTTSPDITPKNPEVGQTLTCSEGVFPYALDFFFQWARNSQLVGTGNTYKLTSLDVGSQLYCIVTVSNDKPSQYQFLAISDTVRSPGPVVTTDPMLRGGNLVGYQINCTQGVWTNAVSYGYSWNRNGQPTGDLVRSFNLQDSDRHTNISCVVTATSAQGIENTFETPSIRIIYPSPINTDSPGITSNTAIPIVGSTLTCSEGIWRYADDYNFIWYRENSQSPIAGGSTYVIQSADLGKRLFCEVTANNGDSPSITIRTPFYGIPTSPPVNTKLPMVTGEIKVDGILTVDDGTWTGNPYSYRYNWYYTDIFNPIATGSMYTIKDADRGRGIYSIVIAKNNYGERGARSNDIDIPADVPQNLTLPVITSYPDGGPDLIFPQGYAQVSDGTWDYRDDTLPLSYQWLLNGEPYGSPTDDNVSFLGNATNGQEFSCIVTAYNSLGPGTATALEKTVPGIPPSPRINPVLTGTGEIGTRLFVDYGEWNYSYLAPFATWYADSSAIGNGESIFIAETRLGETITCIVTGRNPYAEVDFDLPNSYVVTYPPPIVIKDPLVSGTILINGKLTCDTGTWDYPNDPKTYDYTWISNSLPAGSTTNEYTLQEKDNNVDVYCLVRVIGGGSKVSIGISNSVRVVQVPIIQEDPEVTYTSLAPGGILTCDTGSWFYADSYTYQWFANNQAISTKDAANVQYVLEDKDRNKDIICTVEATNNAGSTDRDSEKIHTDGVSIFTPKKKYVPVPKPVNKKRPIITCGNKRVGDFLECDDGKWYAGVPKNKLTSASDYTIKRQWLRDGKIRRSQTGSLYPLSIHDDGAVLSCRITATNKDTFASVVSKGMRIKIDPDDSNSEEDS